MNERCRNLQDRLVDEGPRTLRSDTEAQAHVVDCNECFAFVEALSEIDGGLRSLPHHDAPDAVVETLLERPELRADPDAPAAPALADTLRRVGKRRLIRPVLWGSAAAAALLLVVFASVPMLRGPSDRRVLLAEGTDKESDEAVASEAPAVLALPEARQELQVVEEVVASRQGVELEKSEASTTFGDELIADLPVQGRFYANVITPAPGVQDQKGDLNVHGARERDFATIVGGVRSQVTEEEAQRWAEPEARRKSSPEASRQIAELEEDVQGELSSLGYLSGDDSTPTARAFLAERRSMEGLSFKAASGYWTNAYVPGDPTLRVLQARLARIDPATIAEALGGKWAFHERSRQTAQPFDPPTDAALEVYLHSDRPSLDAEGRLLVQVGLQGTPRHAGRRSALNVGLVLDLRGTVETYQAASIRALLEAFWQARNPGDRFSVTVAGRPGGTVIEPDDFRHGFLSVTADRLLGSEAPTAEPGMGIVEAVTTAIEHVAAGDDPDRPLGSSSVIVITPRPFGPDTETLTYLAHRSAVAGAPVSVVGIGAAPELEEIDRVTLAGHGRRRWMTAPGEAADVVDRELSAAGRAVARAVRLRIRLAPGVKLIDVLAADRLDETQAVLVREAERSIDQRLARNLGIEADRGDDEDGIQIVIPSFYAGDSHVILLDVTAPGPGPIADVTVRYKDLVHLRNGVARAGLTVDANERKPGPLELNVLKNLLALEVSRAMDKAGEALRSGNTDAAVVTLRGARDLLVGIVVEIPELANDPEIGNDIAMLDGYGGLMKADTAAWTVLADSLRYAARLRILPRPEVQ